MILALTAALLFVVPLILLWIGRMIEGLTSRRIAVWRRPKAFVSELTGEEWFLRPMRPMFAVHEAKPLLDGEARGERLAVSAADDLAWYRRPLPPLYINLGPLNWRRFVTRSSMT